MNTMTRLLVIACLALPFSACKKEEAPVAVEAAPLSAPTTDDLTEWRAYVTDVAKRTWIASLQTLVTSAGEPRKASWPVEATRELEGDLGANHRRHMLVFASPSSVNAARWRRCLRAFRGPIRRQVLHWNAR